MVPAVTLAVLAGGAARPALAVSAASTETVIAEATDTGGVTVAPMSDAAVQGAACLGGAALSMGAAYAAGPSELMMVVTGAMHVPSGSSVMFIPMMSILGGGTCAMAAAATPAVSWAIEQSDTIGAQFASLTDGWLGASAPVQYASAGTDDAGKDVASPSVRPMTEPETQSAGCIVGALSGFGASVATAPMEVAMLSSGATTVASSTPILGLALVGTIIASGCGIGSAAALPVTALLGNLGTIGDSLLSAAGGVADRAYALIGGSRTIEVADGAAQK